MPFAFVFAFSSFSSSSLSRTGFFLGRAIITLLGIGIPKTFNGQSIAHHSNYFNYKIVAILEADYSIPSKNPPVRQVQCTYAKKLYAKASEIEVSHAIPNL